MKEIELKAQYDSSKRPELEQYLKEHGFQEVCCFTQQDEYFNHPERDFRITDEALRIRREQHDNEAVHCCLTYKGTNNSRIGQSRRELETRVEDEHKMRRILLALGFRSAAEVKKRRKEYKKEDLTVCLDELDGLVSYNGPEDPDCTTMGPVREIEPEKPGERGLLAQLMERHRPISDFGAANFTRTLVSVTDRAAQMLGDDGAPDNTLRIEIGGTGTDDAEDMAW